MVGESMQPTLLDGDEVLVAAYGRRAPQRGDVVLLQHPLHSDVRVIKRVASLEADRVFVQGDNPAQSTDSRSFGGVPRSNILGRITLVLPRLEA